MATLLRLGWSGDALSLDAGLSELNHACHDFIRTLILSAGTRDAFDNEGRSAEQLLV